jgi:hypothetical protein
MNCTFQHLNRGKLDLEIKLCIIFQSWTEKLNFTIVANILKISVRGFVTNLIFCP